MCEWADAASLQQRNRLTADLPANDLPPRYAINSTDKSANTAATRHVGMWASAGLRSVRELSVAAGLSLTAFIQKSPLPIRRVGGQGRAARL